ncbi:MAG: electron transport complex subunit RsxG [Pseudohongiellaceae bacterium]
MDKDLSSSIRTHSLILAAFALAAALFLGLVNQQTQPRIIEQHLEAQRQALYEVLPPTRHDNDLVNDTFVLGESNPGLRNLQLLGLEEASVGYIARLDKQVSGIILPAIIHDGYSGDIRLLAGINPDGSLSAVRVLAHQETPGLGDKIELRVSDWILDFQGRSLDNPPAPQWRVKKDGGDFDQFVGATITPRAVVNGVSKVLQFYEDNRTLLLEGAP